MTATNSRILHYSVLTSGVSGFGPHAAGGGNLSKVWTPSAVSMTAKKTMVMTCPPSYTSKIFSYIYFNFNGEVLQ